MTINTNNETFIDKFSDTEIVAFFESISLDITDRVDFDIKPAIQEITQKSQELGSFVEWAISNSEISFGSPESEKISRDILNGLINHPQLGPYLIERGKNFVNEKMSADIIMSVGMAASLMFLAASTSLSVSYEKEKGWRFSLCKDVVSTSTIKEIVKPLSVVATEIRGAIKETESST